VRCTAASAIPAISAHGRSAVERRHTERHRSRRGGGINIRARISPKDCARSGTIRVMGRDAPRVRYAMVSVGLSYWGLSGNAVTARHEFRQVTEIGLPLSAFRRRTPCHNRH
jgi:hypothetical protein